MAILGVKNICAYNLPFWYFLFKSKKYTSIKIVDFHNLYKDDVEGKYFISRNTNVSAVLYFISLCYSLCSSKCRQHI